MTLSKPVCCDESLFSFGRGTELGEDVLQLASVPLLLALHLGAESKDFLSGRKALLPNA